MRRLIALMMVVLVLGPGCQEKKCGGSCRTGKCGGGGRAGRCGSGQITKSCCGGGVGKCAGKCAGKSTGKCDGNCAGKRAMQATSGAPASVTDEVARLSGLVRQHCSSGEYAQAQDAALRLRNESLEAGAAMCQLVGRAMVGAGQTGAAVGWYERIPVADLERSARVALLLGRADALCADGRLYAALDLLSDSNRGLPASVTQTLADHLVTRLLRERRHDEVVRVVAFIGELEPRREGLRELVLLADMLIRVNEGELKGAIASFRENAGRLSDVYLARAGRSIASASRQDTGITGELGEFVVSELSRRQVVVSAVAIPYVSAALREKDLRTAVERLEEIGETSLSPEGKARVCTMCGYELIGARDNALIERFVDVAKDLVWRVSPEGPSRIMLARQVFDSYFVLDDLESAAPLFEIAFENERNKTPEAYEGIRHKFLAHMAITSGDHASAIENIRRFMEWIANSEDDQYDPTTGTTVPKGLILGLNTGRIGDELLKMGEEEGARNAYREAVALYEGALATLDKESATYIRGSSELKAISKKAR